MSTLFCRPAGLRSKRALLPMALALALASPAGHGAVDLPTAPLQSAAAIPSNILFMLDDSGSMQFEMMPESLTVINQLGWPAIVYLFPPRDSQYGDKNYAQHKAFLDEVDGTPAHQEIIDWFLSLPLWLDLEEIRVVHACWHQRFMDSLAPQLGDANCLTEQVLFDATREPEEDVEKDTPDFSVFKAVEALIKGIEIPLPKPHSFTDKDGHQRFRVVNVVVEFSLVQLHDVRLAMQSPTLMMEARIVPAGADFLQTERVPARVQDCRWSAE